jgi:hypothetical protein
MRQRVPFAPCRAAGYVCRLPLCFAFSFRVEIEGTRVRGIFEFLLVAMPS